MYLRLLMFLLPLLIPACKSFSLASLKVCSADKLNKQDNNKQPCCIPFSILNQSVVSYRVLTVASWPAYKFLRRCKFLVHIVLNLQHERFLAWKYCTLWSYKILFVLNIILFMIPKAAVSKLFSQTLIVISNLNSRSISRGCYFQPIHICVCVCVCVCVYNFIIKVLLSRNHLSLIWFWTFLDTAI